MSALNYQVWEGPHDGRRRAAIEAQDAKFRAAIVTAHPNLASPKARAIAAAAARSRRRPINAGPKKKVEQIIAQVARKHGLVPKDLTAAGQFSHISAARQEAAYRLRTEVVIVGEPMSYSQIGAALGGRDHSTILHGVRRHAAKLNAKAAATKPPKKARDWILVEAARRARRRSPDADPRWERIAAEACEKHGITFLEMVSPRREPRLVYARHEAWSRVKSETAMSIPAIGQQFKRDPTTIAYGVAQHEERMRAAQQ